MVSKKKKNHSEPPRPLREPNHRFQSPAQGRVEQIGKEARLSQDRLCLVSTEAAAKPPTREQCPRPRSRSSPERRCHRQDRLPARSPLPAVCFKAALFPVKHQPFHPEPAARSRAPASEAGNPPHPGAAEGGAGAAARASAALCCAPTGKTASPRPDGTSEPRRKAGTTRPLRQAGRCPPPSRGRRPRRTQPRGARQLRRGMRSPPERRSSPPAPSRSLTHSVLLVLRGYPHARNARASARPPPQRRQPLRWERRSPASASAAWLLPPRSAAAARPRRRTHCSAGRAGGPTG